MSNIIACIIARTNSRRLKQKVLQQVNEKSLIEYIIGKFKRSKNVSKVYICTSDDPSDSILVDIANTNNINIYQGSPLSVVERLHTVALKENADHVIRITGDNIFCDEVYTDIMIDYHLKNKTEYTRTEYLPLGITSEIISTDALNKAFKLVPENFSQYLMFYLFQPEDFDCQVLIPEKKHQHPFWNLTVDTPADLERSLQIIKYGGTNLNYEDILTVCNNKKISDLEFINNSTIKFPASIKLTYSAFRKEIENRISQSKLIQLNENEYKEYS